MKETVLKKIRRNDKAAKWIITTGGFFIILCVIGILLLIFQVALPLFYSPEATLKVSFSTGNDPSRILRVGNDDYLETGFLLNEKGEVRFFSFHDQKETDRQKVTPPTDTAEKIVKTESYGYSFTQLIWNDGSVSSIQVRFFPTFDKEGKRTIDHEIIEGPVIRERGYVEPEFNSLLRQSESKTTAVLWNPNGTVRVRQMVEEESLFGDAEIVEKSFEIIRENPDDIGAAALTQDGNQLYLGTSNGFIELWDLSEPGEASLLENQKVVANNDPIIALSMVQGDVSVAIVEKNGHISSWNRIAGRSESLEGSFQILHRFPVQLDSVAQLSPAFHNKSLITLDQSGRMRMLHTTSERLLFDLSSEHQIQAVSISERGNSMAAFDKAGRYMLWYLDAPHPEVSWKVFFGKMWYESYLQEDYVWQSSSGSNDFEPKFSLVPLIFGSLKGTIYAMIFALPIALFGAVYTNQFLSPRLRNSIKSGIEIMAAVPSVIIGFLAALWFAPLLEKTFIQLLLLLGLFPLIGFLTMFAWSQLKQKIPGSERLAGKEFWVFIPVMGLTLLFANWLGPILENAFMLGNYKQWLFGVLGINYDQRNSIIIAFALGFLVIPIIYTIAEDAISNVPESLTAASLALGATKWQTVWRVVLPSASPGIFAGIIIGFGRAVGETMVVLMATGNTPIVDWSIFNGMRTLSANIAVEMPEAPVDGTLYRTLFLSAVILFVMTFVLNTGAELIRQKLRNKYGRF